MNAVLTAKLSYATKSQLILNSVAFTAYAGDVVCILGRNGSGKTTLLKCLAGVLNPSAGAVSFHAELQDLPPERRIAYMQQSLKPAHFFSVMKFVSLADVRNRIEKGYTELLPPEMERYQRCMKLFHVDPYAKRDLTQLSGGEWKRVQLAQVWSQQAHTLILDEPDGGLDHEHQHLLANQLRSYVNDAPLRCAVVTTHHLDFAVRVATRILLLDDQTIVMDAPRDAYQSLRPIEKLFRVVLDCSSSSTLITPPSVNP